MGPGKRDARAFEARFADVVTSATVAGLVGLLSYSAVAFRDTLTTSGGLVVHYLLPAAALLLVLLSRRLPHKVRVNFAIAWVALGLACYAAEATIRATARSREATPRFPGCERRTATADGRSRPIVAQDRCRAAMRSGSPFDTRSSLEVALELRGAGVEAWPTIPPRAASRRGIWIELPDGPAVPLGGISRARTVFCNEEGYWVTFDSDEHGFRNPAGLHEDAAQLVLLGDSFTEGQCVRQGEIFADRLRSAYPATLNLGYAANGPLLALASFLEYGAPLEPDHVIWFFFEGNDLQNLEIEMGDPLLTTYLTGKARGLRTRQHAIDSTLKVFAEAELESELALRDAWIHRQSVPEVEVPAERSWRSQPILRFALLTDLRGLILERLNTVFRPPPPGPFDRDTLRQILQVSKRKVESWGGDYTVVYLPSRESMVAGRPANAHRESLMELFAEVRVPVIDMLPVFTEGGDAMRLFAFRTPGHYTSEGHALIAQTVLKALGH